MTCPDRTLTVLALLTVMLALPALTAANGGPFVVKYPGGDPAAKGVLARLGTDLRPGRESRLEVIEERLGIGFEADQFTPDRPPLAKVTAEYLISNPTADPITIDFGFPILRGLYIHPLMMIAKPDVGVKIDGDPVHCTVISNSVIYGIIRSRAREVIDAGVENDIGLQPLVARARDDREAHAQQARQELSQHLTVRLGWSARDARLMVEYSGLDLGFPTRHPLDAGPLFMGMGDPQLIQLAHENLGPLSAIGEQKATQFLALLASHFDPDAGSGYEEIFSAWGGDVRERSIDLATGRLRPRQVSLNKSTGELLDTLHSDPTIYARVDYLDPDAELGKQDLSACRAILKHLPVIFTFAPMNLLHYQAEFPPGSVRTITVSYRQYAFLDTGNPESYQLAYVIHPASLWEEFGPIRVELRVPEGVSLVASFPISLAAAVHGQSGPADCYRAVLTDRTGEVFVAVSRADWNRTTRDQPAARFN